MSESCILATYSSTLRRTEPRNKKRIFRGLGKTVELSSSLGMFPKIRFLGITGQKCAMILKIALLQTFLDWQESVKNMLERRFSVFVRFFFKEAFVSKMFINDPFQR